MIQPSPAQHATVTAWETSAALQERLARPDAPDAREGARILRLAAARIRRGWTVNMYARDASGGACHADSPDAVCWCVLGAIDAEHPENELRRLIQYALEIVVGVSNLPTWNDRQGQSADAVAEAMDAAAARLEALAS